MRKEFKYGISQLTPDLAIQIANGEISAIFTEEVKSRVIKNYETVQKIAKGKKIVYSVNTGFGSLCTTIISKEETGKLQENLLKSHSVGIGKPIEQKIAKLMLILKIHTLCRGFSGISLEVIERINWHVETNIIPLVPEQGSVGASGDLAPLAHLFLPLIALGYLSKDGKNYHKTAEILNEYDLSPLKLHAKEGLALINGTQFICAHAVIISEKFSNCLDNADIVGALSLEAYLGSPQPFDEELIKLRPHHGAILVAEKFRRFLSGSQFIESHKDCGRVQDPYSIRCIPQVHGASRDAFFHFNEVLICELNSVTDNPIIFNEEKTISGGNFHGQPLALPLDYVGLAASGIGNISDRRTYLLLEGKWGLPAYLIKESGLNSGFMITQYSTAALASENKSLCFPASADSIPTSMGQEDHVSMGSISARKTLRIVVAIELLCAAQAFDFRRPLNSSVILEACHTFIRQKIPHLNEDVVLSEYIDKALDIIKSKELVNLSNKD